MLRDIRATLPIAVRPEGRRRVRGLDLTSVDRRPTLATAIAASFGAGFAGVFQGTQYKTDLEELRERVIRTLHDQKQNHFHNIGRKLVVLSQHSELLDGRDEDFDTVLDCVLRQRVLLAHYKRFSGREEKVRLTPYSILVADDHLYVLAPEATGELHPFRFVRLSQIEPLTEQFPYPTAKSYNPQALFKNSFGIFMNLPVGRIRLRFNARWGPFLHTHQWHASQRVLSQSLRHIDVSLRVSVCPELERWILSFGDEVKVISPVALQRRIAEHAHRMARNYA